MLISIIIPIYNVEKYIKQCVDSIINQTYKNIEIILVDDGSPDNCPEICDEYAKSDNRIKVIHKKNGGQSDARNAGLEKVTGDYVMFVDGDDWIDKDTCEKCIISAKNDADLVMFSYRKENGQKSYNKFIFSEDIIFNKDDFHNKVHRRMAGPLEEELKTPENFLSLCTVWGKLYKKEIIGNNKFIDIKKIGSYEDGLFNLYIMKNVNKAIFLNKYFYHYRLNDNSIIQTYKPDLFNQHTYLFSLINDYIIKNNYGKKWIKSLSNYKVFAYYGFGDNIFISNFPLCKKYDMLKKILNDINYNEALKQFNLKPMPLHWKCFYFCIKHKFVLGYFLFLYIINIIRKNNK